MVPESHRRYPAIDALRGACILLVVLHHLALRIPLQKSGVALWAPRWLLATLSSNGYEAVFIFFVASGFLITRRLQERAPTLSTVAVRDFYVRRFARIAPCLLLLLVVLSLLHLLGVQDYVIDASRQSLPRALLSAICLHLNWYEGTTGYLPGSWDVLWSLSIEEVFYLAFPWLCRLTRSDAVLAGVLLFLAVSLPFTHSALQGDEIWQEKAYLPAMGAIATGVLASLVRPQLGRLTRPRLVMGVGLIGILAVLTNEDALWTVLRDGTLLVLTLSTALFLLAADPSPSPHKAIPGLVRSWGRLTYEVYLTHMFVVFAVVRAFKATGGKLSGGALWYVPLLAGAWLLGVSVARWFSIPAERWLRALVVEKPGGTGPRRNPHLGVEWALRAGRVSDDGHDN